MKRKVVMVALMLMVFTVAGCGSKDSSVENDVVVEQQAVEKEAELVMEVNRGESETIESDIATTATECDVEVVEAESVIEDTATQETVETQQVKTCNIDFANIDVCFAEATEAATPITFILVSEQENDIIDTQEWVAENNLFLPMLGYQWEDYIEREENAPAYNSAIMYANNVFYDENYVYEWSSTLLNIYDRSTTQLLYSISYQMDQWYLMGNCAYLRDGILYMCYNYNGYAQPGTCYLLAYDVEKDAVVWRSEDQTYNSMNFLVRDNIIICGYGFTAEDDYIYQIDMNTGRVIDKTKLNKQPELFSEKDGQLYVRTYSYDYVFDMK